MRGILNIEGAVALLWLVALWLRSREAVAATLEHFGGRSKWLLLLAPVPFLPFLNFPFLADDYVHILHARQLMFNGIPALFTVPASDHFFRPAAYLSYALDSKWAGWSPGLWRAGGLALHAVNTALVYILLRKLLFQTAPAVCGALLFAVHGSRPEVVTWVAARFDLLAVLFGLTCLLLTLDGRPALAALALFAAVLSKESAFVVPLIALALLWYVRVTWREMVSRVGMLFVVAAVVFVYRWHLLGGVGGYHDAVTQTPTVFQFGPVSTLQALFPRFWGTLLFPLNWSERPGMLVYAALGISVVALLWLATGRVVCRQLALGIAFAYACAIPVHQFLSIGADLEKSRVLYFASIGFAIIFAATITTRTHLIAAACVLLFQCAALEHNLEIWKSVGYRARAACQEGAHGLPNVVNGVYFLHTGYPECLEFR